MTNDTEFWDAAYRTNAPALLGTLQRYTNNAAAAQDLLHETFITAIGKHATYSGKGSFEGWLHRIAVNTALMHLRNQKNRQCSHEALRWMSCQDSETSCEHPENARTIIEQADFTDDELLATINRLPEHHKTVFNLYVIDGYSHKQIATQLNISPGTSKSHLARARHKIQQYLYMDALGKTQKKRTRRAGLLFFIPAKAHFIDRLYRGQLLDYKLPAPPPESIIPKAIAQTTQSAATHTAAAGTVFWGAKLSYIAACCTTAVITSAVWWLAPPNPPAGAATNLPVQTSDSATYPANFNTIATNLPVQKSPPAGAANKSAVAARPPAGAAFNLPVQNSPPAGAGEPIIVKKKIIQRQTVVVRDTVIIIE